VSRILQAAHALRAQVVTNDRYLLYCPWHTYNTTTASGAQRLEVQVGRPACHVPLACEAAQTVSLVSRQEWTWTHRHRFAFACRPPPLSAPAGVAAHVGAGSGWVIYPDKTHSTHQAQAEACDDQSAGALLDLARLSLQDDVLALQEPPLQQTEEMQCDSACTVSPTSSTAQGRGGQMAGNGCGTKLGGMSERRRQKAARFLAQITGKGQGHAGVARAARENLAHLSGSPLCHRGGGGVNVEPAVGGGVNVEQPQKPGGDGGGRGASVLSRLRGGGAHVAGQCGGSTAEMLLVGGVWMPVKSKNKSKAKSARPSSAGDVTAAAAHHA